MGHGFALFHGYLPFAVVAAAQEEADGAVCADLQRGGRRQTAAFRIRLPAAHQLLRHLRRLLLFLFFLRGLVFDYLFRFGLVRRVLAAAGG